MKKFLGLLVVSGIILGLIVWLQQKKIEQEALRGE